jgi:nitroreductase
MLAEKEPCMKFDLEMTDELLATTRAVRKRLDLERAVPRDVILECLELAVQAPTASNSQNWRWVVVDDASKRGALADIYRKAALPYLASPLRTPDEAFAEQTARVRSSALWLAENLEKVPVFVIPCVQGKPPADASAIALAGLFGSIFPAVWSFQLALRARGLGSALTTLHLLNAQAAADLLGLPDDIMQVALLPVAYTKGTDFKRAARAPVSGITHWNAW